MHAVFPHPLTSLAIGKCYLYINKKDEAKKWLEEAANFKSSQAVPEGTAHAYVNSNTSNRITITITIHSLTVKKNCPSTTEKGLNYKCYMLCYYAIIANYI